MCIVVCVGNFVGVCVVHTRTQRSQTSHLGRGMIGILGQRTDALSQWQSLRNVFPDITYPETTEQPSSTCIMQKPQILPPIICVSRQETACCVQSYWLLWLCVIIALCQYDKLLIVWCWWKEENEEAVNNIDSFWERHSFFLRPLWQTHDPCFLFLPSTKTYGIY